jgi:glycerol-3-phosphate acyltransferase PlsX
MKIAVDAMGGDNAPLEIVKGSLDAAQEFGVPVILVGDSEKIERELSKYPGDKSGVEVKHASEVVEMGDHPAQAIRRKSDSSIVVAGKLVRSGEAQALVSAGNTGAAMAVATLVIGRIPGIVRPGIASFLPTQKGKTVMLDAGANVDCSVENLMQFALMGNEYAARVMKVEKPRIGLLSIGEEPTKGDELTKATNAELAKSGLNFIGNVEGKDVFRGAADVVVCDGFTGNVTLKVAEGMAELILSELSYQIKRSLRAKIGYLFMKPALRNTKGRLDYAEYGGAPLLGVNGVTIIGHGRSDARAIRNAIRAAINAVENDVVECIQTSIQQKTKVESSR